MLWKKLTKDGVHALDNALKRAVIGNQAQGLWPDMANSALARFQKDSNLGLAESIDGLHGIAHQKECASFVGHPIRGQAAD